MTAQSTAPRMLVVDDAPEILTVVERFGLELGFEVTTRLGGAAALAHIPELRPDVVIVDLQMPEVGGLDVLRAIREVDPECHVIVMTGNPTLDTAIQAIKSGALDYLTKPIDFDRMRGLLTTVREGINRRERLMAVEADVAGRFEFYGMIGRSAVMQQLFDSIRRLAPHIRTVLITGETGTGKELVAKALHALGPRHAQRFVTVNCSAVVENLFESELFGHVRGAFTGATEAKLGLFEYADQGTLFLDEAGELPLVLQPKLLRAVELGDVQRVGSVESHHVDVQVIAATNRNLRAESDAKRFRSDLFYRLCIIEIHLVPLRERREDIPYLTARFISELAARLNRTITGVSSAGERLLQQASWPGNVRELKNVIERACILGEGKILGERDVQHAMSSGTGPALPAGTAGPPPDHRQRLSTAQKEQIERVLHEAGGNKAAAAKLLGVSRRSLYRWLDRLNIDQQ
jgi:two-component system response regulator HydG